MNYDKEEFYHDIIESMVTALEVRDTYTSGHSLRVSDMANKLCDILKIEDEEKETIHIAAHLHDIGKIGVSDSVLNKEGKLTDSEWEELKCHSEIGYNILVKSKLLRKISNIVLSHHERFDGRGYPNGISGENIPYGSRIIAICDSIDAMKSDRPYRNGLDDEYCRSEIEKNLGIMYDPKIGKVVLENFDEILKAGGDFK